MNGIVNDALNISMPEAKWRLKRAVGYRPQYYGAVAMYCFVLSAIIVADMLSGVGFKPIMAVSAVILAVIAGLCAKWFLEARKDVRLDEELVDSLAEFKMKIGDKVSCKVDGCNMTFDSVAVRTQDGIVVEMTAASFFDDPQHGMVLVYETALPMSLTSVPDGRQTPVRTDDNDVSEGI